jgi:TRAP-type C4-dicarboxylate transport system permease small subunit
MNWRSNKIWLPLLIVCVLGLFLSFGMSQKATSVHKTSPRVYKGLPPLLGIPPPLAAVPAPTNYLDLVLKVGSCLGALMTLLNLIEKVVKWLRPKKMMRGGDTDGTQD